MLVLQLMQITISTHALREEGDPVPIHWLYSSQYFYPRPPRGGRRSGVGYWYSPSLFLPTPSARRATSIAFPRIASKSNFYPRPPRGGRQSEQHAASYERNFYPRPPRGGRPDGLDS